MMRLLNFIPALLWLVAAAMMGKLVHTIATASEHHGPAEWLFALIGSAGFVWCLHTAWGETKAAKKSIKRREPFWVPAPLEHLEIGSMAGNRYPLTDAQVTHIKAVLSALDEAGLVSFSADDQIALIREIENEFDGEAEAYETFKMLHGIFAENDLSTGGLVYTTEQSEVYNSDIAHLCQSVLALGGVQIPIENVAIDQAISSDAETADRISIKLPNRTINIACTIRSKYTPDGLIEGLAKALNLPADDGLYWENLDSSLVICRLSAANAKAFNARMKAIDDNFSWTPVLFPSD
jgi:hypothetical protein